MFASFSNLLIIAGLIAESLGQILQFATYLQSQRGLLFGFEKLRRPAIDQLFFQLVVSFEAVAESRYHLPHAFDLTRTAGASGSSTIAHDLNSARQLVHEKVMVTAKLRDCLTRFRDVWRLVCAPGRVTFQSPEDGGKKV